jgi:hypothetical protein
LGQQELGTSSSFQPFNNLFRQHNGWRGQVLVKKLRSTVAGDDIAIGSEADRCLLSGVIQTALARDDVFAEKQAANHYHYHDGATHMTKAEADCVQKALHYWNSTVLPDRPSNQLRLSRTHAPFNRQQRRYVAVSPLARIPDRFS